MTTKHSTCVFCDGGCPLAVEIDEVNALSAPGTTEATNSTAATSGAAISVSPANPDMPAICSKAIRWNEIRSHEGRILHPLKNVGERGEPVWRQISWDDALDEIAERLSKVVDEYGPQAVAASEMPLNHGVGGITRRFLNHLGSPNYITALELCMGNTAQVHRATYGWFTSPRWDIADCIVYFGQNRGPELWPREYCNLKAALSRDAKLIVVDPRVTPTAQLADYHLRINYGTDAALALSWVNVIIEEGLFDEEFVRASTVGFEALAERATQYPPERVAAICGIDAELIRKTARIYAGSQAALIPWGATGDMQRNSTSLLRCQCILRAICGFVNKSEMVFGPSSSISLNAQLADYDALPQKQKDLQIGTDTYPLFTFKGGGLYEQAMHEAGFDFTADIMASSCMAHPASLFAAMRGEGPYPVKAFFSIANNTVMSYANMPGIVRALMNQDLVVTFEVNMTPTAQLSDYVLPGDMWMERDVLGPVFDVAPAVTFSQAFTGPLGECRNWYHVAKGLADRLGFGEAFPWANPHELFDWRLASLGTTWDDACSLTAIPGEAPALGTFLTPSGKVELASSVLEQLGYDPLPYYEKPAGCDVDRTVFPYEIFVGAREPANYNTNLHQIGFLRERTPEPLLYINPADAAREGIAEGDDVRVTTAYGSIAVLANLDDAQPASTLRVPHGWWKPETAGGVEAGLSSALLHNDGMLFPDDAWNLDPEQGLPNLRGGIFARIERHHE